MKLAIVADDLTGACDAAVAFATRGLPTVVVLDARTSSPIVADDGVLAIDADSRRLGCRAAAARTAAAARAARSAGADALFKKVDSTLRGHVAAELEACRRAWGAPLAVLCPAFPAVGRWVQGGRLFVDGRGDAGAVAELAGLGSARLAHLPIELVERGAGEVTGALARHQQAGIRVVIADANAPHQLVVLAEAAEQLAPAPLLAGSAGLAGVLAGRGARGQGPGVRDQGAGIGGQPSGVRSQESGVRGSSADPSPLAPGPSNPWLVVAGSQTAATAAQVTELERAGAEILVLDVNELVAGRLPDAVGRRAARVLADGVTPVLRLVVRAQPDALPSGVDGRAEDRAARALGRACRAAVGPQAPAGLFLTGGLTARACLRALGVDGLALESEPLPGIARGRARGGDWDGRPVITKAGGFGAPDAIRRLVLPSPAPAPRPTYIT